MSARTLLRGGHIISMDPKIGDISGGDVLIEGEDIAAVAPSVDTTDCEIIDASAAIIIPGLSTRTGTPGRPWSAASHRTLHSTGTSR